MNEINLLDLLESSNQDTKVKILDLHRGLDIYSGTINGYFNLESAYDNSNVINVAIENNTLVLDVF